MNNQENRELPQTAPSLPLYFPVSPLKLIVMSVCTGGIYELYWFYKNWGLIKERENVDIMPFWRAFFSYFFCYSLFKKFHSTTIDSPLEKSISPVLLSTGWVVVSMLWKLPEPYWLISYSSVLFLLPAQAMANEINSIVAPNHDRNRKFTSFNIFGVIIGSLFFFLILLGTFILK
ncbi:MAG: hypothetical protein CL815_02440 [Coraliomargarita sp.]|nr:hypothetical protein [Coraliomargarita sp.]|tara:strand:+ start:560 stop:1084 length:525 start_codon:yes stop_codon:yes gene_type:complete